MICKNCGGTGKIRKVIPSAFIDCECKLSIPERYDMVRLHPEDFDFPMSDTFRAYSFEYCGQPDPGYMLPMLEEHSIDRIQEPQWTKKQWDAVQQLKAQVLFLSDKVNGMRASASKRKTYTIK